jgi:hypothetical protein
MKCCPAWLDSKDAFERLILGFNKRRVTFFVVVETSVTIPESELKPKQQFAYFR